MENDGGPLAEPEPVTGPWVYTEAVYLFIVHIKTVYFVSDI